MDIMLCWRMTYYHMICCMICSFFLFYPTAGVISDFGSTVSVSWKSSPLSLFDTPSHANLPCWAYWFGALQVQGVRL